MSRYAHLDHLADLDAVDQQRDPRPGLHKLDAMALPDILPPIPARPVERVREDDEDMGGASAELEALTPLALKKYREALEEPTDFDDIKKWALQLKAANDVIAATLKVDEGRLKRRKLDILPKLLEIIAREEKGRVLEHAPIG